MPRTRNFYLDLWRLNMAIKRKNWHDLREGYRGTVWESSKYWRFRSRLAINLRHAWRLGLHRNPPRTILDLGSGFGYFPYICAYYGHDVLATDMDVPFYREAVSILDVPWRVCKIEAFQGLPDLGRKFDLITGLLTYFNNAHLPEVWGVEEWRYFLRDLAENQLQAGGQAYFALNRETSGHYYDQALLNFFTSLGARVDGGKVLFPSIRSNP